MMRGLIVAIFIIGAAMAGRRPPKPNVPGDTRGLLGLLGKYINENKRINPQIPNYGNDASGDYSDYGNYKGDYGNYKGDYGNYKGDYGNYKGDYGNYKGDYGNYEGDYGNYDGDYGNYYNDTDDDMECSNVTPPCVFKQGDDVFYKCAFLKLRETEEAIKRIVKDNFGENLFDDYEMDLVWELRKDWKLSVEMKEVVEMVFMEIAEARFTKHDWDKVNSAAKEAVDTKICEYFWLREQTFEHGKFFHKPTHYRRKYPL